MDKEDLPQSFKRPPSPSNGLREVLESIRTIFVASIALVISIGEWVSRKFKGWQANAEKQAEIIERRRAEDQAKIDQARRLEEQALREESRKAEEQAKIAEERRAEERVIREEERKAKEKKLSAKRIIYPALSTISTIALLVGVARLAPIAKWTKSQNECIGKTFPNEGASQESFATKVMRCNGGHD